MRYPKQKTAHLNLYLLSWRSFFLASCFFFCSSLRFFCSSFFAACFFFRSSFCKMQKNNQYEPTSRSRHRVAVRFIHYIPVSSSLPLVSSSFHHSRPYSSSFPPSSWLLPLSSSCSPHPFSFFLHRVSLELASSFLQPPSFVRLSLLSGISMQYTLVLVGQGGCKSVGVLPSYIKRVNVHLLLFAAE